MNHKWKWIVLVAALSAALTGCSQKAPQHANAGNPTDTQNVKELVKRYSGAGPGMVAASINSTQLTITDDTHTKKVYDLPKTEFFVSIAPYLTKTHP